MMPIVQNYVICDVNAVIRLYILLTANVYLKPFFRVHCQVLGSSYYYAQIYFRLPIDLI